MTDEDFEGLDWDSMCDNWQMGASSEQKELGLLGSLSPAELAARIGKDRY